MWMFMKVSSNKLFPYPFIIMISSCSSAFKSSWQFILETSLLDGIGITFFSLTVRSGIGLSWFSLRSFGLWDIFADFYLSLTILLSKRSNFLHRESNIFLLAPSGKLLSFPMLCKVFKKVLVDLRFLRYGFDKHEPSIDWLTSRRLGCLF